VNKHDAGAAAFFSGNFYNAERDCWEFQLTGGEGFTTEISKLLHFLLVHPECMQKVMEEIGSLQKDGDIMPWKKPEVPKLKYLVRFDRFLHRGLAKN